VTGAARLEASCLATATTGPAALIALTASRSRWTTIGGVAACGGAGGSSSDRRGGGTRPCSPGVLHHVLRARHHLAGLLLYVLRLRSQRRSAGVERRRCSG
jgi:hypothetical protein